MFYDRECGRASSASSLSVLRDIASGLTLEIHGEVAPLAQEWTAFERRDAATLFQSHAWLKAWASTAAAAADERPLIIIGRDGDHTIRFIWPMAVSRQYGTCALGWLGQDHSGYAMGLNDPAFAISATGSDIRRLLALVANRFPEIALAHFRNQPEAWNGVPNPFAALPRIEAPNAGFSFPIGPDFETLYTGRISARSRASLRRKERRLAEAGPVEVRMAETVEERLTLLKLYLGQKAVQFRERGITNIFAEPAIKQFYTALARAGDLGKRGFEYHYLSVGEEIAATLNGVQFGDRFYGLTNSLIAGELKRWSPGLILMREHIAACRAHGVRTYDLGTGRARHKEAWKPDPIPLFETRLPLRAAGWPAAILIGAGTGAKRIIKNNPRLWQAAQTTRRTLRGRRRENANK